MATWRQTENYSRKSSPTPEEADTAKYIEINLDSDFSPVLKKDRRLGVFFHLSPMRESLLNWYPFDSGAAVLELGGGMGAVTGLLCSRCARVVSVEADTFKARALLRRHAAWDNLTVINAAKYGENEKFDYVVLIDPDDLSAEYLACVRELIKPRGKLLLATENRFGLRYWCGKRSRITGRPFDTVDGSDGSIGKAELSLRLEKAGFEGRKWYYPMSDHWFAQDIFSENYLPATYSSARFRPYIEPDGTLIMNEHRLYKDVIQGQVFEFFSSAYLVEARLSGKDEPCAVDYAAVTTYRTPEKRFATLVMNEGGVKKIPLHADGARSVRKIIRNHEALAGRGISVVPLTLEGESIVMPRVPHETLIDYWQRTLQSDSFDFDAFSAMFDRFYDIISRSSECDPPGSHGCHPSLGPVMKTAYMELVPANCFYDADNDELIFFDQEFTWSNCPLKIALARAFLSINYSTLHLDKRAAGLLKSLKKRYGLDECWDLIIESERVFLAQVFNYECIEPLVRLRRADEKLTKANVRGLLHAAGRDHITADIPRYLSRTGVKSAAIYGYGTRGKRLHSLLELYGPRVLFALDQKGGGGTETMPVYKSLEQAHGVKIDMIIVSPREGADEIAAWLREKTPCSVMTVAEIYKAIDENEYD